MGNNMKIEKLIEKFYLKSLTDKEMVFLLNYLRDKEPQHEILSHYLTMWDEAGKYNEEIDSNSIYDKIVRKVGFSRVSLKSVTESPDRTGFRAYIIAFMRYAAVFVFAFGLFWLTQSILFRKSVSPQIPLKQQSTKVEVPLGSKSRVFLPDGSVVTLNSGSILKYSSSDFDSIHRSVFLIGEGFFNVTKDTERPFYVNTSGIKLKVLGTTFNVKAYPEERSEEATLISGLVQIYASSDLNEKGKPIVLKPNQSALFVKSENALHTKDLNDQFNTEPVKLKSVSIPGESKAEQKFAWKENRLVFDNQKFSDLIVQIERWYDVKITVDYQELNTARFSGEFEKETLEQVMNALSTATPFSYTIKQNIVTISKK